MRFETLESRLAMAGLVINEFLASNVDGIVDQDGDHSDWIEVKNTSAVAVDLAGWRLTDESANLGKWQFPAMTLDPGALVRVFASDKNRSVAGQELHTNFKLAIEGEYLALVEPDGTTIASSFAPYPAQRDDVSYGIGTNPSSTATETLIGAASPLRVHVPTAENAAVDDNWRELGFNDSGAAWLIGARSVGFDRNGGSDGVFGPFIGRDLSTAEMPSTQFSAYVRYTFNLSNKDQLTSLALAMRFDDGFIAYINGREVQQVNFGDDFRYPAPAWNSRAGNQTNSSTMQNTNRLNEALTPVVFDLTPYLPSLVNGTNVLAFHLVNGTNGTTDLLLEPVLTATRTGGTQTGFMAAPTPGGENGVSSLGYVGDTHFSVDRGFFDAPFQVAITADAPTASIRYTTDGSLPSATNGTLYVGPINVAATTILRAIAYQTGYTSSNVDTQTYIFLADVLGQNASDAFPGAATWGWAGPDWEMDPDIVNNPLYAGTLINDLKAIPTVSLVMNSADLFSGAAMPGTPDGVSPQGIYITGKSKERYASFEFFNPQNALDQTHADIAVEIQGHSSTLRWRNDKLSFQVKFKYPYGPTELNYPLFAGTPDGENATSEFDTLILDAISNYGWTGNNAAQTNFARYVTDQVTADLQNLASGGGQAPHGKYVHLYLNGLYWGMYNMHERPDDSFANEYYGGDKDDYYVVKAATDDPDHKYTHVEGGVAAELSYQALLNANPVSNYAAVREMLDIDQFVNYMIVHFYAGNANDWPHNNWYATRSSQPGGKWRFHEWDQEHAFPTSDNGDGFTESTNATVYNAGDDIVSPLQIHRNLMGNQEYRLRFADRVQGLMYNDGALTPAKAQAAYAARINEISRAIVGESARWGDNRFATDPYTRADFMTVNGDPSLTTPGGVLSAFFPVRTNFVLGHFKTGGNDWIPTLVAPVMNQYGGTITPGFDLELSRPAGSPATSVIYYTTDGTDPRLEGGGLSSSALVYNGPIDLPASTRVKSRIFFDNTDTKNDWSPLVDKSFVVPDSFKLRIVELNYHPAAHAGVVDEEDLEFIELLNTGSSPISLNGVKIGAFADDEYEFPNGLTLAAGERIVVARSPAIFTQVYGTGINLSPIGYANANLSNSGELVTLIGPAGEIVQSINYTDDPPWPTAADGDGRSLEIIDPLGDSNAPGNWRASLLVDGSPGTDGLPSSGTPGDFNGDDDVDGHDFLAWQLGLGTPAPNATTDDGDADGDRDVDNVDLALWADNYGEAPLVAAAVVVESAVEWPTGTWIVADSPRERASRITPARGPAIDAAHAAWGPRGAYRPAMASVGGERVSGPRASGHSRHESSISSLGIGSELADILAADF